MEVFINPGLEHIEDPETNWSDLTVIVFLQQLRIHRPGHIEAHGQEIQHLSPRRKSPISQQESIDELRICDHNVEFFVRMKSFVYFYVSVTWKLFMCQSFDELLQRSGTYRRTCAFNHGRNVYI